jgi:pimeloyl-ACP methyl ester carboxylesterase
MKSTLDLQFKYRHQWSKLIFAALFAGLLLAIPGGCSAPPMGADRSRSSVIYAQTHNNAVNSDTLSATTMATLRRFDLAEKFEDSPDEVLRLIHQKALALNEHELLFALSELNFTEAKRLRHSFYQDESRDPRDYYLAAAVYAWLYLFDGSESVQPGPFDVRFRTACDLYNYGLGRALVDSTRSDGVALLKSGTRHLPLGDLDVHLNQPGRAGTLSNIDHFVIADALLVRGLSVRNRRPGLGAPLVAVGKTSDKVAIQRNIPATVLLRVEGGMADLYHNTAHATLEVYAAYETEKVEVGGRYVPLAADTTIPIAYSMNQAKIWDLGSSQFLSGEEKVPSDVYSQRPYEPGLIPVVFVHGTASSPIWWAEMVNTLSADPVLGRRYQFWYFIYNSGNPIAFSSKKLRDSLTAKLKQLDPEGKDPALQQMVVIGHSQGGLHTRLTATDTRGQFEALIKTDESKIFKDSEQERLRIIQQLSYTPLPFVKRVVFISTPHRGSYQVSAFLRRMGTWLITLPSTAINQRKDPTALDKQQDSSPPVKYTTTSLDGMSPKNPYLLKLADLPLGPGIAGHSIIAIRGDGEIPDGKDGVVSYKSAHVACVESEFIVRSFHSCQDKPATIEEVRRILYKHLSELDSKTAKP